MEYFIETVAKSFIMIGLIAVAFCILIGSLVTLFAISIIVRVCISSLLGVLS